MVRMQALMKLLSSDCTFSDPNIRQSWRFSSNKFVRRWSIANDRRIADIYLVCGSLSLVDRILKRFVNAQA